MPKPILETPRLFLREMTRDDLDFVAAMLADLEVMRYSARCYGRGVGRSAGRALPGARARALAGVDRNSGEPVGQVGLIPPRLAGFPGTRSAT